MLLLTNIITIRGWYGLKYAVVKPFKYFTKNDKGEAIVEVRQHPVEYTSNNKRDVKVAIFPHTKEGLAEAQKIHNLFKNKK